MPTKATVGRDMASWSRTLLFWAIGLWSCQAEGMGADGLLDWTGIPSDCLM
jgi:hypothetical protein